MDGQKRIKKPALMSKHLEYVNVYKNNKIKMHAWQDANLKKKKKRFQSNVELKVEVCANGPLVTVRLDESFFAFLGPPPYPYTREGRINKNDNPYFDKRTSNGRNYDENTSNLDGKVDGSSPGVSISLAGPPGIFETLKSITKEQLISPDAFVAF